MALQIIWTENALEDYHHVVDYLLKAWPYFVAENFVTTLEQRVKVLSIHPNLGIASIKDASIRSIIITKHNKLYYRVASNSIEILNIFDTRQNPEKDLYQ